MSYSYRLESRFFFWILSVLVSSLVFSILYFFKITTSVSNSLPLILSLFLFIFLFFVGIFSVKTTFFFYNFIVPSNEFEKLLTKINIDDSEKSIQLMVKRFKEIFYNLSLSEKEKSISTIQKTVGLSKDSARNIFLILKNIRFTKNILIISGLLISLIVYILLTNVDYFIFLKQTILFPIFISLIILLIFIFEGILVSNLPANFYLNLVNVNKKQLSANKKNISIQENNISSLILELKNKKEYVKQTVSSLTRKGISKQDIISILDTKQISAFELKDLVMQANEEFSKNPEKTTYEEVNKTIEEVVSFYKEIKELDKHINDLKEHVSEIKEVQDTLEKINTPNWDYYKNIKFEIKKTSAEDKQLSYEITNKIKYVSELRENKADMIRSLYNSFLPYKDSLTVDKIYSILISKGYPYETIVDLLDEFKKNNIDLTKNKSSFQDKIVSKINNLYDSFKD